MPQIKIHYKIILLFVVISAVILVTVYKFKSTLLGAFLIAFALSIVLGYIFSLFVFRSFKQMEKAIRHDMSERIEAKITELTSNTSRLEAVFLSMFEGLMVVDEKGVILLMNQPLKDFMHVTEDPLGYRPIEVIRNVEIQEITDKVLKTSKRVESREISVLLPQERVILIHGDPVMREGRTEGAVLVFHDITELRRLEKVRRDFVANVSHELRTPVATIKGYTETLLDGAINDKDHAREFLEIIHADADRLAKLITDLLDLSRVESGQLKLDFKSVHVHVIAERIGKALSAEAQKSNISIINNIAKDIPAVRADETVIAQVFLNLIENAIKYNEEGGRVEISAQAKDHVVEVHVKDNGIGIPQEDIPRIFERFYRVDKAHSRQLGVPPSWLSGTGLGLSIVKHIIQAHDGEVSVTSTLGHGSTFSFTLPQA